MTKMEGLAEFLRAHAIRVSESQGPSSANPSSRFRRWASEVEAAASPEGEPVARVTLLTLQDGKKAKVLRALSEQWIIRVPDGTALYEHPAVQAPDYSELLQQIREAAGDPTGKLMQDDLVQRIAALARNGADTERAGPDGKDQVLRQALEALEKITRRLQMDIDDGGRPDQWSMEDLVRIASPAIRALQTALGEKP